MTKIETLIDGKTSCVELFDAGIRTKLTPTDLTIECAGRSVILYKDRIPYLMVQLRAHGLMVGSPA